MSPPEFVLKGKNKNYPILITHQSIMAMEQECGVKITNLFTHVSEASEIRLLKKKSDRDRKTAELAQTIGLTEVMSLLFAGLEGYRRKFKTQIDPITLDDVDRVLTDCGGIPGVQQPIADCFTAYWPTAMGLTLEDGSGVGKKKTGTRRKKSKSSRNT
jgi:hypothetical protein